MINALGWICTAFLLGFLLGGGNKETIRKANPAKVIENAKAKREIREKTKISQIELNNFMNYNGDPMPDPKEVVAHGG